MDTISFLPFFLQSFPENIVITALGLTWTGAKVELRKLSIIAIFATLFSYAVRSQFLLFGIHTVMQFLFLTVLLHIYLKYDWRTSLISILLGSLAMGLAESIIDPFILFLSGLTLTELLSNPWLRVLVPLPHIALLGVIAWLSRKREWVLIPLAKSERNQVSTPSLLIIILLQAFFIITFNVIFYAYKAGYFLTVRLDYLFGVVNIILIAAALTTIIIAYKMLHVTQKEAQLEERTRHLEALQELYTTVRTYKHDFFNHLSSLYGFLKTGDSPAAQTYIKTLYKEVAQNNMILDIGIPALSGLLHTKAAVAGEKGIDFKISIDPNFNLIPMNPIELTGVVGNLIDNALDAVMIDNPGTPTISVDLLYIKREQNFIMEVSNTGQAPAQEVLQKMFTPGFSTKNKDRHSGLGLTTVKNIVRRYGGWIKADYSPEQSLFIVHICIPEK